MAGARGKEWGQVGQVEAYANIARIMLHTADAQAAAIQQGLGAVSGAITGIGERRRAERHRAEDRADAAASRADALQLHAATSARADAALAETERHNRAMEDRAVGRKAAEDALASAQESVVIQQAGALGADPAAGPDEQTQAMAAESQKRAQALGAVARTLLTRIGWAGPHPNVTVAVPTDRGTLAIDPTDPAVALIKAQMEHDTAKSLLARAKTPKALGEATKAVQRTTLGVARATIRQQQEKKAKEAADAERRAAADARAVASSDRAAQASDRAAAAAERSNEIASRTPEEKGVDQGVQRFNADEAERRERMALPEDERKKRAEQEYEAAARSIRSRPFNATDATKRAQQEREREDALDALAQEFAAKWGVGAR